MKLLLTLLTLLSINSFAYDKCIVKAPRDPELTSGINKDTICDEVFYALKRESIIAKTLKLRVTGRSMYSVSLKIKYVTEESTKGETRGVLHWYPGDSYVILSE
jgi:hypothetical protein